MKATRLTEIPLVMFGAAALALLWANFCTAAAVPWNPARLAASAALAEGLPLYVLRDSGAHLGWFYGPVFPLWHLPAMLLPNISALHFAASVWNAVTLLAPLALFLWAGGVRRGRLVMGLTLATVLLLGHGVLSRNFFFIHVDAVCLALGALACFALHGAVRGRGVVWLHTAAVGAVLAVWTKQIAVALLPALLTWLWRECGRAMAARFAFWLVVHGAAVTVLFFAAFGIEEILFNTVLIHLRNPNEGGWLVFAARLGQLGFATLSWLPLIIVALWATRHEARSRLPEKAASLIRLLLWCAVWQLPLGLSASIKVGGGLNSLHSLHYAFVAALIWLGYQHSWWHAMWPRTRVAMFALIAWLVPLISAFGLAHKHGLRWQPARGQEQLVKLAREMPGKYYFPWNPLVTIREEGRVQPLDNALFCLWLAGLEPPAESIRAAVFPNPVLVYEELSQSKFALRYFPSHRTDSK